MAAKLNLITSLQQMCLAKLAVPIFNCPEVAAFIEKYGAGLCIWPSKETEVFLDSSFVSTCHMATKIEFAWSEQHLIPLKHSSISLSKEGEFFTLPSEQWENLMHQRMSTLQLPDFLKRQIITLTQFMVIQIDKWIKEHAQFLNFEYTTSLQNSFSWTSGAKINRQKTAKTFINNSIGNISECFYLACHYCFEEDVNSLWMRMNADERYHFLHIQSEIVHIWTNWITGVEDLDWQKFAINSVSNPLGLQVYFSKLTEEDKLRWLVHVVKRRLIEYDEVQFCLLMMGENQQIEVFKSCALQLLENFLDWPRQTEILEVADVLLQYLSLEDFVDFMDLILYQKIMLCSKDFNYIPLIKELWNRSPASHKEFIKMNKLYNSLKLVFKYDSLQSFPHTSLMHSYDKNYLMFLSAGVLFLIFKNKNFFTIGLKLMNDILKKFYRIDFVYFNNR